MVVCVQTPVELLRSNMQARLGEFYHLYCECVPPAVLVQYQDNIKRSCSSEGDGFWFDLLCMKVSHDQGRGALMQPTSLSHLFLLVV